MNEDTIRRLIAAGESLTVEFKSDQGLLADAELLHVLFAWPTRRGRLVKQGRLELVGRGRAAYYRLPAGKTKGDA